MKCETPALPSGSSREPAPIQNPSETERTLVTRSVITDTEILSLPRIIAEIDAVEPGAIAELASVLLAEDRLSAAGIGPSEKRFSTAVRRVSPALVERLAA